MGEYLFVDPSLGVRNGSGESMSNGSLKEKAEPHQYEDRYATQAGSSYPSWFSGAPVCNAKVKSQIH